MENLESKLKLHTSCCKKCVHTSVLMRHMDPNKKFWEKARWELHKGATSYFDQYLEATPHETIAVPLHIDVPVLAEPQELTSAPC